MVVRNGVCSRLGRVPTGQHQIRDEFSTLAIFPTCICDFPCSLRLSISHTVSDSISSILVWYVCSSHSTFQGRRPRSHLVSLPCGHNIFSSISRVFQDLPRLLMYVLHPVSIHCRHGVMSFSFFHPLCLWVKAVVGKEWGHFVCVGCRVIICMFGQGQ